ncbi:MAG TPA: hypothetical protein VLA00_03865 [Xanthobacteraceae bacterium]|nr:hypothetical protein [Xanthobacteraceae bacterium]
MPNSVLIVSRHDYRTPLQVNIHFIARALAEQFGEVNFVSVAFSAFSRRTHDDRHVLASRANRWERWDDVNCYLWRMLWHPVSIGGPLVRRILAPAFDLWQRWPCEELDKVARRADLIIIQSGPAPALLPRLRALAPKARFIYLASDLLDAAGVHPRVQAILDANSDCIDKVVVVARSMIPHFAGFEGRVEFIPHGLDRTAYDHETASPFTEPQNIVSIGSMLFDPSVIQIAAEAFPNARFHLIGTPEGHSYPSNVREYGPMPFAATIAYLQHADVGVAAYAPAPDAGYLADSSLKLMQFGYLGIPAVCPNFAVGERQLRFGYEPGDPQSVRVAFQQALDAKARKTSMPVLSWNEVVEKILAP